MTLQTDHHLSTHWIRGVNAVLACCWMLAAFGYWELRGTEVYFPVFWPLWFLATGLVTLVSSFLPWKLTWVYVAGAMSVTAAVSRVVAVFFTFRLGSDIYTSGRFWVVLGGYTMLTVLMSGYWLREVAPWAACERRRRA